MNILLFKINKLKYVFNFLSRLGFSAGPSPTTLSPRMGAWINDVRVTLSEAIVLVWLSPHIFHFLF